MRIQRIRIWKTDTFTSFFKDKSLRRHKTVEIKVFLHNFCLMMEGSGSVLGTRVADPGCYLGSEFFPSLIPDPNFFHPGSRFPDPHQRIEVFKPKKWFQSYRKYDTGCSSRIRNNGTGNLIQTLAYSQYGNGH
jgi:hypothetical protein